MIIPTEKRDFKIEAGCCNPDIILRNWSTASLKIEKNPGIACSNRFVDRHYKRILNEFVYNLFVVFGFCAIYSVEHNNYDQS